MSSSATVWLGKHFGDTLGCLHNTETWNLRHVNKLCQSIRQEKLVETQESQFDSLIYTHGDNDDVNNSNNNNISNNK